MTPAALQDGVHPVRPEEGDRLVEVWEASVRATHHFLAEPDIESLRPHVREGVLALPHLCGVRAADGALVAFLGVAGDRLEALFAHPSVHGAGVGRRLARHAVDVLGARRVDVNEQNGQAVAFYRRMGFEVFGRSPVDDAGRPFPLLHMRLAAPRPLMILVAGPYRSGTGDDPGKMAANVRAMEAYALPLFRAGHVPLVGEWLALPLVALAGSRKVGDAAFEEIFHPIAERLLARCDALLRVGGPSQGADLMVRVARARGLRVFERLRDVPGCEGSTEPAG